MKQFFIFELRRIFKSPAIYIFFLVVAAMVFGTTVSDSIVIGGGAPNIYKNAPYKIFNIMSVLMLIGILFITALMNNAATRDFQSRFHEILFTKPIGKQGFLWGRFLAAVVGCVFVFSGVNFGIALGCLSPWVNADLVGPFNLWANVASLLFIALPNAIIVGSILFVFSLHGRNTVAAFIGSLVLLVGYIVAGNMTSDIDNEWIASLSDAFGIRAFSTSTKYMSVFEKNNVVPGLSAYVIGNRILWVSVALIVFIIGSKKFKFSSKGIVLFKRKQKNIQSEKTKDSAKNQLLTPNVSPKFNVLSQAKSIISTEIKTILRSPVFIVILAFGVLNLFGALMYVTDSYGLSTYPVTYEILDTVRGAFYIVLIAVITFYSGALIWKERDNKMSEIVDALPYPYQIVFVAKWIAMIVVLIVLQSVGLIMGVLTQVFNGYSDFNWPLYLKQLYVLDLIPFVILSAAALFFQVISNNKFVGYFFFIAFLIANAFAWPALDVESKLIIFGDIPSFTYTAFNGIAPYTTTITWFMVYWTAVSVLLAFVSVMLIQRGKEDRFKNKISLFKQRFNRPVAIALSMLLIFIVSTGIFIYHNTHQLNKVIVTDKQRDMQADYEKKYKKHAAAVQPKVTHIDYKIDLFASERNLNVTAQMILKNLSQKPVDSLFLTFPSQVKCVAEIASAKRVLHDTILNFSIYKFEKALLPGDSFLIGIQSQYINKGFENEVSFTQINQNGSFFNNYDIMPIIGYSSENELGEKSERKKRDLADKPRAPKLERNCSDNCMQTYFGKDAYFITTHCIFSTDAPQTAIAPGKLIKKWQEGSRNYFEYALTQPSLNFYSFLSAEYEIKSETVNGISYEVYYHKNHHYNVDKMLNAMKLSIEYYEKNFGKYRHDQARIIEFPRYSSFAQAFPGTMPYSESIGFIANLEDTLDVDMVTYVVAHEMGHQWWAHQVIGADMQGGTMLSETFAQYSALMVMEKLYGRERMSRFLKYELDRYLMGRSGEIRGENPLMKVENQPYIHYQKGSLVMYAMRDYLSADTINRSLKKLVDTYGYKNPPFPTTHFFVDDLLSRTPDSLQSFVKEQFAEITLYDNRMKEAVAEKTADGKYEITFTFECKKLFADSIGNEKPAKLNDYIEIGCFREAQSEKENYGKSIWQQKIKVKEGSNTYKVKVNELPEKAAIDPLYMLVDRIPSDNSKKISLKN